MKKFLYTFALLGTLYSCKTTEVQPEPKQPVVATLDLVNVEDDKVKVSVNPDRLTAEEIEFNIPKTVPGT
ncbi:MAG TPA: hypothetical protein VLO29_10380, partial [Salegentibacter sp.]|nr:hypothetical protein [Salegentibacter sp.]